MAPIFLLVRSCIITGDIEYNPTETSIDTIAGLYSNGDKFINLGRDGFYNSRNIHNLSSGKWSNHDWNLSFSNAPGARARLITRNGIPCILPYYAGVDAPDGLLLTIQKHEPQR